MTRTQNRLIIMSIVWVVFAVAGMLAIFAVLVLLHDDVLMHSDSSIAKTLMNNFSLLLLACISAFLGIMILAFRKLNRKSGISNRQASKRIIWTATIIAVVLFLFIIGYFWLQAMSQLGSS